MELMKKLVGVIAGVLLVVAGYVCWTLLRPLPLLTPSVKLQTIDAQPFTSDKLDSGRGAIGFVNPANREISCRALGNGEEYTAPKPTASIAKLITAQVVLGKMPLAKGESGPSLSLNSQDEASYWQDLAVGGSSVQMMAGQTISQRQLLEGTLLASANNMANRLAIWAFGSMDNYRQVASQWLRDHELADTIIGTDASGLDPSTKSTPTDLCKILLLASQQPILAEIMSESEATMPSGEVIHNTNRLLGRDGVFAGKTGFTHEAGRGVVTASRRRIDGVTVIVGVVSMGNDSYNTAFRRTEQLLESSRRDIAVSQLKANTSVGKLSSTWGASRLVTAKPVTVPYWVDSPPKSKFVHYLSDEVDSASAGSIYGQLSLGNNQINVITERTIKPASLTWRLTHPF